MKFKKIICSALIAAGIFSSFATTAFAANTIDKEISVVWAYSEPSFQLIKEYGKEDLITSSAYEKKEDTSKIFFKFYGSSGYVDVKACAVTNAGINKYGDGFRLADTVELTYSPTTGKVVSYARCNNGKNYGISSLIKEKGYTYATLRVKSSSVLYGTGRGCWSPDSSQTHNIPTYHNS